jgi:hypothetical protein
VPLRKSPVRSPALLAANRANALKSTGPRTVRGKARSCLNALKHGRYATRLGERLLGAGDRLGESRYRWFCERIAAAFGAPDSDDPGWTQVERFAVHAWCAARQMEQSLDRMTELIQTKPVSGSIESERDSYLHSLSQIQESPLFAVEVRAEPSVSGC